MPEDLPTPKKSLKELEKENTKLDKIYDFLENAIYSKDEFINRSKAIKENIQCSECGWTWLEDCDASDYPDYCPHCGARRHGGGTITETEERKEDNGD